ETFDLYAARRYSPVLAALVSSAWGFYFPFGLLLPLGLIGAAMSRRRWRELWWFWAMGLTLLISLIGYFNSSRYRLSLAPIIVLFAAVALVQIWERYRHRPGLWRVLGTVVVVAVILNWPIDHFTKRFNFEAETEALAGAQLLNEGRQPESLAAHKR